MSQTEPEAGIDMPDEQLNRAIEELRGVLKEEQNRPAEAVRAGETDNTGIIMNIPVDVQIVLGSTEMPVSELMALQKGSTVALNRRIGEPVDVEVNGRRNARGEITVLGAIPPASASAHRNHRAMPGARDDAVPVRRNTPTPNPSPQGGGGLGGRRSEFPSPLWGGVRGGGMKPARKADFVMRSPHARGRAA